MACISRAPRVISCEGTVGGVSDRHGACFFGEVPVFITGRKDLGVWRTVWWGPCLLVVDLV